MLSRWGQMSAGGVGVPAAEVGGLPGAPEVGLTGLSRWWKEGVGTKERGVRSTVGSFSRAQSVFASVQRKSKHLK